MDYEAILTEAHNAAAAAVVALGPEDMSAMDCGFAWVSISGNDRLARHCRDRIKLLGPSGFHGDKGYPSGWQWWKPGNFRGQAIGHHQAGANAFNTVLAKHGIRGVVGSRYD